MPTPHASAPEEIPQRFCDAWNRYDARAIANLFTHDADFINVTGRWWENREEIFHAHDFGLRVIFQHSQLRVLRTKVKPLDDTHAVIHAHFRLLGQTEHHDNEADLRETLFLFVAQRIDGTWRCISAQNTDIVFGQQTNLRHTDGTLHAVSYKERIRLTPEDAKR